VVKLQDTIVSLHAFDVVIFVGPFWPIDHDFDHGAPRAVFIGHWPEFVKGRSRDVSGGDAADFFSALGSGCGSALRWRVASRSMAGMRCSSLVRFVAVTTAGFGR
jgi:hypothetical protein